MRIPRAIAITGRISPHILHPAPIPREDVLYCRSPACEWKRFSVTGRRRKRRRNFRPVFTVPEKTQWKIEPAWSPVRHAAKKPFPSVPPHDGYILAWRSIEYPSLIPGSWNVVDERKRGLSAVSQRVVGNHLKRRFIHYVHG